MRGFRVVVCPDSFKGSLTAKEASAAIAAGVRLAVPDAEVIERPMADGGEGTMAVLAAAWGVEPVMVDAVDATGRPCQAAYALSPDAVAIVELASASGLPAVSDEPLRPLDADTSGTGEVLAAALRAGAREVLLGVGGSASTDGGSGILRALGVRLLDASGREVPRGGRGLADVTSIDTTDLLPQARDARWRIAVDVTNPLVGPHGAAMVYGPQKGATHADLALLDAALTTWARVLGIDPATPGFGAAGGVPAGLAAVLGATLEPGATLVAKAIGLPAAIAGADLVITGEGRFDSQSLAGKVVAGVVAAAANVPVIVLAGEVALEFGAYRSSGVTGALSITPGPASLDDLVRNTAAHLTEAAAATAALAHAAGWAPETPH